MVLLVSQSLLDVVVVLIAFLLLIVHAESCDDLAGRGSGAHRVSSWTCSCP